MADLIKIIPKIKGCIVKQKNCHERIIIDEIREICKQLESTELWFQNESDNDLIEACIHQREVLNARYKYLINKLREKNPDVYISPQKEEAKHYL